MLSTRNSELKDVANAATLIFKQKESEEKYREEKKQFCLLAFVTLHVCAIFAFIVEMVLKKRDTVNIVTFVVSFIIITFFWLLTGAGRCVQCPKSLTEISKRLHYKYVERTIVTTVCVLLLIIAEVVDVVCTNKVTDEAYYNPMFYSYNGVLILLVVCTLIQLPYVARITLLLVTTVTYPILFFCCMKELFQQYDTVNDAKYGSPSLLSTSALLTLQYIFYFFALFFHSYQSEKTARVLMLWKKEASKGKDEVESLKKINEILMRNILPQHVIDHFLTVDNKDETELYSRSYGNVGVIFASIPNFAEFYCEDSINKDGIECMRVLNEIISDFDEVLSEERFDCIEKIKTVNSTYMAASGLKDSITVDADKDQWDHLVRLTDFALALKEKLNDINGESFNNFALRIGIAQGPVVAGVIGAKKPHYDIWGNTVNISSRMESTGKAGTIQVLSDTYEILKNRGFEFEERGYVYVKGKGKLLTYILVTQQSYDYTRPQRPMKTT
jgi:class 3 adenylate cyclase